MMTGTERMLIIYSVVMAKLMPCLLLAVPAFECIPSFLSYQKEFRPVFIHSAVAVVSAAG